MAYITKRGNSYSVRYTYEDEHGKSCDKWESFPTNWTVEEMRAALDSMEDPILHLAVHLTLVGALREGEIVGLTPEDLDFDAADGIGTFRINKSMQRVRKEALNQVDDGCIIKVFPDKLERSTTSLILKSTKTASSCRTIFMTSALKRRIEEVAESAGGRREKKTRHSTMTAECCSVCPTVWRWSQYSSAKSS